MQASLFPSLLYPQHLAQCLAIGYAQWEFAAEISSLNCEFLHTHIHEYEIQVASQL